MKSLFDKRLLDRLIDTYCLPGLKSESVSDPKRFIQLSGLLLTLLTVYVALSAGWLVLLVFLAVGLPMLAYRTGANEPADANPAGGSATESVTPAFTAPMEPNTASMAGVLLFLAIGYLIAMPCLCLAGAFAGRYALLLYGLMAARLLVAALRRERRIFWLVLFYLALLFAARSVLHAIGEEVARPRALRAIERAEARERERELEKALRREAGDAPKRNGAGAKTE